MIGWLLDTNVISEIARPAGAPSVMHWAARQDETRMFISVLTLGEFDKALYNLPHESRARPRIEAAIRSLEARFSGRILSVSDGIVRRWGRISGRIQRQTGKAPPVIDTFLAATAIDHDLYLVTRNVTDVVDSGAAFFNPWTDDLGECVIS